MFVPFPALSTLAPAPSLPTSVRPDHVRRADESDATNKRKEPGSAEKPSKRAKAEA